MGEVARQISGGKGGTLFGLFGRKRRSKKNAQSADGPSPCLLGDADKMPLAKFLMIAEENFGGYPSRKVPPKVDGTHPSCNVGQSSNKARLSSPTVVARLMGLEPLPSSPRGKQLSVRELKKDQVTGEVCSKKRNVGRKQHRKLHGDSTKGRDVFTRTTSPNSQGPNVEIFKPDKELRERARLAMKSIPSYINEEGCYLSRHFERSPKVASSLYGSGLQKNKARVLEKRFSPGQNSCYDHSKKRVDVHSRSSGALGTNFSSLPEMMALSHKREGDQRELYSLNRIEDFVSMSRNREQSNPKTATHKLGNGNRFVKDGSFDERVFACEKRQKNTVYENRNGNAAANSKLPKQSDTSSLCDDGEEDHQTKLLLCMGNNTRNDQIPKHVGEEGDPWTKDLKVVSVGSSVCKKKKDSGLLHASSVKNRGEKVLDVDSFCDGFHKPRKSTMELNVGNTMGGGDRIGALLEQKIMELRSLDQHDTDASDEDETYQGRSSASILEELISALTNRQSVSGGNKDAGFECHLSMVVDDRGGNDDMQSHPSCYNREGESENLAEAKSPCASSEVSLESDCYGPSPVSTLEPTFSSNNSISGSIGTNAVNTQESIFTKDSSVRMQLFNLNGGKFASERASHILDGISIMYNAKGPCEIGAVESRPNYSREVISNIELLFANVVQSCRSKGMIESSVDSLLLDSLEVLVDSSQSFIGRLICPGTSERSQIRRFLFDCMVEHLDLKYSRFITSGYKTWLKMSLFNTSEKLASEVSENINKWMILQGKFLNAIMSTELSQLPMDHTAFDTQVYDLGIEIGHALLHGLLSETLMDLLSA